MRIIKYLTLIVLTTLSSCSDNEAIMSPEPSQAALPPQEPVLVTKIITDDLLGGENITEYFYNGTTITSVVYSTGKHEEFLYIENRLSSIKYFEDGELQHEDIYEYNDSGQLTRVKTIPIIGNEWGEKYSYDLFGVNVDYYMLDAETQEEIFLTVSTSIQIEGGNIVSSLSGDSIQSFTFDQVNNPFLNATGFDVITKSRSLAGALGINNVVSYTPNSNDPSTTTYTYNSAFFPVTSLEVFESGREISKQYFYNY